MSLRTRPSFRVVQTMMCNRMKHARNMLGARHRLGERQADKFEPL